MPKSLTHSVPTVLIRRTAFEGAGLTRAQFDEALNLTADEFRVEGGLIAIGPLVGDTVIDLIADLERVGLIYHDDYIEMSGNWPSWLRLFTMSDASNA